MEEEETKQAGEPNQQSAKKKSMMGSIKGWFSKKKELQPTQQTVAVNKESAPIVIANSKQKSNGSTLITNANKSARLT